jgi:multicomponent Na+:H+ antiporter subunit C
VGLAQRYDVADPVPQAMVLTGIVVAVAATALALALVRKLHALTGQLELPDDVDA